MKHKKIIVVSVILLAISFIVIALSNSTYALFSNDSYGANTNAYSTGMLMIEASSKSENISLSNALPMSDEEGLRTNPYVFTIKNIGNLDYLFDVKLLSTGATGTAFSPQYIKLQIDNGSVTTLANLTNGKIKSNITLLAGKSIDISIRVWLSIDTPNTELGKSFNSKIVTDGQAVYTTSNNQFNVNAVQYIRNLYTSGKPTLITQDVTNDTYYYSYQSTDQTWGLMNDGLKVSETEGTGATTITDTTALTSGTEGNIRYFGPSESVNNYVYFNCSDYNKQSSSTCEKWRIIGIVDGKVKIIRDELMSGGGGAWNYDPYNSNYTNNWSIATLNAYLNGDYYDSLKTKNNKTIDLIEQSMWYLGGYSTPEGLYPNDIYNYERTNEVGTTIYGENPFTVDANIGLMYASDYGYATDLTRCSRDLSLYNSNVGAEFYPDYECFESDWLYSTSEWFINPDSVRWDTAWYVSLGNVDNSSYGVFDGMDYRPVLYLDTNVMIGSGDGSSSSPYQLYVQEISPLSDFTYYLGSEYPTVNSLTYYHIAGEFPDYMVNEGLCNIQLEENEVLLVRYIGDSTTVSIPDTYVVDGITYNVTVLSYAYDVNGYATGIFYNNENISKVFLGDNIKLIEGYFDIFYDEYGEFGNPGEYYDNSVVTENSAYYLFFYCTNLLSVSSIPSLVTNMDMTFQGCTNLVTAPEIPNSVTNMNGTFEYCASLVTAPEIPSSVTNMNSTFSGCTSLVTAPVIPSSVTDMFYTFSSCTSLVNIPKIPNSVTNMHGTFAWCTSLVKAPEIPSSVTDMQSTFYNCTSLVGTVTINSSNVSDVNSVFGYTNNNAITALVPAGSTTYNTFSSASLPSNVTLSTFNAG